MAKKNQKKMKSKPVKQNLELFFFSRQDIGAKTLCDALAEEKVSIQCWPAMDILELEYGEAGSVDIEKEPELWKEGEDGAFLRKHGFRTVFALTVPEGLKECAVPLFEKLCAACDGVVCPDTDDFMPVFAGSLE